MRIGAVNYLNSKPLIEALSELAPHATLILDYPSRLADELAEGRLDVALIPSIECLLNPEYEVVSDACVATHGPVLSVKLYSRVPLGSIRVLELDEGSRTSAALVRILLAERYGVFPELKSFPLGQPLSRSQADAVLVIGDRAIHPPSEKFSHAIDLGAIWNEWTGLPFVFAMWAARAGNDLGDVEELLGRARDIGVNSLAAIGRREAPRLELPVQTAVDYLTKNLYYRLGPAERNGLAQFQELAVKQQLVPEGIDLVFRNCIPA